MNIERSKQLAGLLLESKSTDRLKTKMSKDVELLKKLSSSYEAEYINKLIDREIIDADSIDNILERIDDLIEAIEEESTRIDEDE